MKRLLLLRHGKSDWDAPFDHDRERPVATRGRRAAAAMGEVIAGAGWEPDRALTSPAVRAQTTLELAAQAGAWQCPVDEDEILYSGDASEVLERLRQVQGSCKTVLVVGHEPVWSELLALLIGGGSHRIPTAALAAVTFDRESWQDLEPGIAELRWLLPPKLLKKVGWP
ncbi:MAG: histidine phosphatase family protein [Acidobacteriota bacterium]|nr:histidine phosphatase family protein [Acidobacteriota bacterium]